MNNTTSFHIVTIIFLLLGAFFAGRYGRPVNTTPPEVKTVYDTIILPAPDPIIIKDTHYIVRRLPVHDTTMVRDTLVVHDSVAVDVPIETKVYYKEGTYYAEVQGYEAELTYMEVWPRAEYITNTVKVPPRFTFGVQAGYGVSSQGLHPYIGLGVSYNLIGF